MRATLPGSGLYAILDDRHVPLGAFPGAARVLAAAGCPLVQLRMKGADDRARLDAQRAVAAALIGTQAVLVVNDRPDLAAILHAETAGGVRVGLHLGQDDLPPEVARRVVGPQVLIGLSTHDEAQARAAASAPVDYVGFGPVFATRSKERPDPVVGLDGLARAVGASAHPVVAIGGLDGPRAVQARGAGAWTVAMIAALYEGLDLGTTAGLEALRARAAGLQELLA